LLMVALALFAAACGEDDEPAAGGGGSGAAETEDAGSGAQAEAKAAVDEAKKIPEFKLEAEPVDLSKVKGKKVFNIPVASTIPYVAAVDKEMAKVARDNGVEFVQYENEGNPTQWAAGFNQAIQQRADLIIMQAGNDPRLVVPQLRRAKEAGIPVLVSHLYQNGTEPPAEVKDLITSYVTVPFHEAARLSADYAVAESGCGRAQHADHQREGGAAVPGHRQRDEGAPEEALPGREDRGVQRPRRRVGHADPHGGPVGHPA
jgi:ribose transport system substrate-binding protein